MAKYNPRFTKGAYLISSLLVVTVARLLGDRIREQTWNALDTWGQMLLVSDIGTMTVFFIVSIYLFLKFLGNLDWDKK